MSKVLSTTSSLPESAQNILSPEAKISDDISPQRLALILTVFDSVGVRANLPDRCHVKDFFSDVVAETLKPLVIQPGRFTCLLNVKSSIINFYATANGGAIASIAEAISTSCVRTIIGKDKKIFLGQLRISYLSAVHENAEVIVEANVVKSGRNVIVVTVDFGLEKTQKPVYQARATFFNMPVSKL